MEASQATGLTHSGLAVLDMLHVHGQYDVIPSFSILLRLYFSYPTLGCFPRLTHVSFLDWKKPPSFAQFRLLKRNWKHL